MAIRIIYAFFLGLLLALFVGMGIAAFYPAPKFPEYPEILSKTSSGTTPAVVNERPSIVPANETPEQKAAREKFEQDQKDFQKKSNTYNRNVSIIALAAGVILMVISLSFLHKIDVLADGLLLGGIFNTLYSIGRGFTTDDVKYQFFIVTAGLFIALILGYIKFIAPTAKKPES